MKQTLQAILMFTVLGGLVTVSAGPRPSKTTDGQGSWIGTVSKKEGNYFLTQDETKTVLELRGAGLAKHAGHHVQLMGTQLPEQTPAPGASQVVKVGRVNTLAAAGVAGAAGAGTGAAAAAGSAGAAGATGAAAAGTMATVLGSTTGVVAIGAGATAATVGSLYATDVIGDPDKPASRP